MSPPASPTTSTGPGAGPSRSPTTARSDLWSEILSSADRQKLYGRKNILLLSERHHGRRHLLTQLLSGNSTNRKRPTAKKAGGSSAGPSSKPRSLAMGYEVLQVREEGDEESVPPVSIFYPPSSHSTMTDLIGPSLPPDSIQDTAVLIVLDWTKPWTMISDLLSWLKWVSAWAESTASPGEAEEMRDRLQSLIQHYTEPALQTRVGFTSPGGISASASGSTSLAYGGGAVLPLGQGTLTLNQSGVPIIVVCTKADLMDSLGEEVGIKGAAWEERTDWVQQVLRTICLAYGAALFYTAPTAPDTYSLLRSYLLHRLHSVPPPLHAEGAPAPTSSRFPFLHRANVLDRDAVMVPAGWDSYGKINVLRQGFDPARIAAAWGVSLAGEEGGEGVEDIVDGMIPNHDKVVKPSQTAAATTVEPEQSFLARHLDALLKDPNRDPSKSFRHAAATASQTAAPSSAAEKEESRYAGYGGVVGPMGSGGLSLPGVEKAMTEMEGAEDLKEKFARLGRRESTKPGGPLSPTAPASTSTGTGAVPNEALHNFFQGLLATKAKSSSTTPKPAAVPEGKEA